MRLIEGEPQLLAELQREASARGRERRPIRFLEGFYVRYEPGWGSPSRALAAAVVENSDGTFGVWSTETRALHVFDEPYATHDEARERVRAAGDEAVARVKAREMEQETRDVNLRESIFERLAGIAGERHPRP
jgi:hypothetical protein